MPKPKPITTDQRSACALQEAIDYAHEENDGLVKNRYGRIRKITEEINRITGANISRQMVGRWLSPDQTKRVEPGFGSGLALIRAVQNCKTGAKTPVQINL